MALARAPASRQHGRVQLGRTVPALPARDVAATTRFYVERLGFACLHAEPGFGVLERDAARLHLWESGDTGWRERPDLIERPVVSGAESFLAGTASCRISVDSADGLADLYAEMAAAGVLHAVSANGPVDTAHGAREFHVLDLDGNLLTFYHWA
jgi:catechol 2,3-dioxygenase-like lactoylglutathione lyase family enzyme